MKIIITILSSLAFILFSSTEIINSDQNSPKEEKIVSEIKWHDFESINKLAQNKDRKIFIYVYTDWCSWCKKMSSTSFEDQEIISLLNDKFYPVKFNGESKEIISFRDHEFNFIKNNGRGYHQLTASLLNNKLSYPSIVFLDEEMNMIQAIPGYKSSEDLNIILKYLGNKIYEQKSFEEYYNQEIKN